MKVVELCGVSRNAGGLFYAVRALCRSLQSHGVDISVYGRRDAYCDEDIRLWNPVEAMAFKAYGPTGYSPGMRRHLMNAGADLAHLHGLWMDDQWASLVWQKKSRKPVVISPHGMLDQWAVRNSAWKKKLVEKIFAYESLGKAGCLHALCEAEVHAIRAYGLKNPIAVIPNGTDLPNLEERRTQAKRQRLLFLGRIHPKKGLKELLQAWATVKKNKPIDFDSWELLIAGWDDGGHERGLKVLAEQLGVEKTVSFAGPMFEREKDNLLRSVDAFILPSFSEGLPMSVLEAWAYAVPVLMTDYCNIPSGFRAEAALRIEPSVDSIKRGLLQLLEMNYADLIEMGLKGRSLVEKQFAWNGIARDMESVYEWCLGGDRPDCMVDS